MREHARGKTQFQNYQRTDCQGPTTFAAPLHATLLLGRIRGLCANVPEARHCFLKNRKSVYHGPTTLATPLHANPLLEDLRNMRERDRGTHYTFSKYQREHYHDLPLDSRLFFWED